MKKKLLIFFILSFTSFFAANSRISAQQSVTSNSWCTQVGNPTGDSPCTKTQGNFTFYCQKNAQWSGNSYACESIGYAGCGPTSMAMVISTFCANPSNRCAQIDPGQMAQIYSDAHKSVCRQGTAMENSLLDPSFRATLGIDVSPALASNGPLNVAQAKLFIDSGYLIVGSSDSFPSCNCGHIFVVQDIITSTTPATAVIRDPINCTSGTGIENTNRLNYAVNSFTWKYAYAVRKI